MYCHTIFLSVEKLRQPMLKKHQLPILSPGKEKGTSAAPTESGLRGKLRRYELSVGEEEGDLIILTMLHKDEIDALIEERVHEGPCKFQLHVDVSMIKFANLALGKYVARSQGCIWLLRWSMSSSMASTRIAIWKWLSTWSMPSLPFLHTVEDGLWSASKKCL